MDPWTHYLVDAFVFWPACPKQHERIDSSPGCFRVWLECPPFDASFEDWLHFAGLYFAWLHFAYHGEKKTPAMSFVDVKNHPDVYGCHYVF